MRRLAQKILHRAGKRLVPAPIDLEPGFIELYDRCRPFTGVSLENLYGLYQACRHVIRNGIRGDVVVCGVWKGGSAMLCALSLQQMGDTSRTLHLFDTYRGMTRPTEFDVFASNKMRAQDRWAKTEQGTHNEWLFAPVEEVRQNLASTGYPLDKIRFVVGDVLDTLPSDAPDRIALVHLDTDFYESTAHELRHLYPRLEPAGILAIDDYGCWEGARRAVDEYFSNFDRAPFLHRTDWSGRIAVKAFD